MPSKLEEMQLKFRQRLMQEKEERLVKNHSDNLQPRGVNNAAKPSRGITRTQSPEQNRKAYASNATVGNSSYKPIYFTDPRTSPSKRTSPGVDRSRPLPPINRTSKPITSTYQTYSNISKDVPYGYGNTVNEVDDSLKLLDIGGSSNSITNGKKTSDFKKNYNSPKIKEQLSESKRLPASKKPQSVNGNTDMKHDTFMTASQSSGAASNSQKNHTTKLDFEQASTSYSRQRSKPEIKNGVSRKNGNGIAGQPSRLSVDPSREQCNICGRQFAKDRIDKHVSICSKSAQKKRKTFDITKMRVKGTEQEKYVRRGMHLKEDSTHKKMDWRKKHEEFINNIRQAKAVQRYLAAGGKVSDLPPPPRMDTSDYVPCPYCGRKFNSGVAERHIPKCKNIISNKKPILGRKK